MEKRIFLASPHMSGKEKQYIDQAFESNWIAPLGANVDAFEQDCASYVGKKYGAATVSGTSALHLAVKLCGVKRGDRVFCSTLTFLGSLDGALYEGAKLTFIESEPETLNMSPEFLEQALSDAKKKNDLPKAVIVVDLYGTAADYDKLIPICKRYGVPLIEDAAEAFGGSYKGKKLGSFGDLSILSFNGNKIITTSGGGMLLTDDKSQTDKARFWSTQSRERVIWYEHKEIGYNYRLSNVCAGIGRGQMTVLDERVAQKKAIHQRYLNAFSDTPLRVFDPPRGDANYWLTFATVDKDCKTSNIDLINALAKENIESRPLWKPMHMQPLFEGCGYCGDGFSERMFNRGICLPSDTKMTEEEQAEVIRVIKTVICD